MRRVASLNSMPGGGGMKRTGSVFTFGAYEDTQRAVESALHGHVSSTSGVKPVTDKDQGMQVCTGGYLAAGRGAGLVCGCSRAVQCWPPELSRSRGP